MGHIRLTCFARFEDLPLRSEARERMVMYLLLEVGGIDKYSTSVFFEKILQYYYIPTIGVADLQAPLNNMLRSS